MPSDPCKLATEYAVRMNDCKTEDNLREVWKEVVARKGDFLDWYSWLKDFKDARKIHFGIYGGEGR